MPWVTGDRVAQRYRVLRALGTGGMASVYLAEDERAGTLRVLKQLRIDSRDHLPAFRAEFATLARVTHPHLSRVHAFGSWRIRDELCHYYVADFLEGETLASYAKRRSAELSRVLTDALEGLSALHALRILHGDFTPDNILATPSGRGVLIDLGCARPFDEHRDEVSGTPGFIAPELFARGRGDARSDLFAVGSTIQWAYGQNGARMPAPLSALVEQLGEPDPERRPSEISAVFEALGLGRRHRAKVPVLPRTLLGRSEQLRQFSGFFASIARGEPGPRAIVITGTPGSGVTRLTRECIALAELEQAVVHAHASENAPMRWLLSAACEKSDVGTSARDALMLVSTLHQRAEPLLLVIEDADRLEPSEKELLLFVVRLLGESGLVGIVVSTQAPLPGLSCPRLEAAPLDIDALRQWTQGSLSDGTLEAVLSQTRGLPAEIEVELERVADIRSGARKQDTEARYSAETAGLVEALTPEERQAAGLALALDGEIDVEAWNLGTLFFSEGLDRLFVRDGERFRLRVRRHMQALSRALGNECLEASHRRIVERLESISPGGGSGLHFAELARHYALSGDLSGAEASLRASDAVWRSDARSFASRLAVLLDLGASPALLSIFAEICLIGSEAQLALAAVARGLRARPGLAEATSLRLLGAEALIRLGRGARAERLLAPLLSDNAPADQRALALERVARARLQRGDAASAERIAQLGLGLDPTPDVAFGFEETLGLAAGYLGRPMEAESRFDNLLAAAGDETSPRDLCRLLGQRAIAAFRAGKTGLSLGYYQRALAIAELHGLDDLVCVGSLNLGTAEQQAGDLGGALLSYERALGVARALGRESTELTLRFNLANLRAEIGDFSGAAREVDRLELKASPKQLALVLPALALLKVELRLGVGDLDAADEALFNAREVISERALGRERVEALLLGTELHLCRGKFDEAAQCGREAELEGHRLGAEDLELRAQAAVARALLGAGSPNADAIVEALLKRAADSGARSLEARLATELSVASSKSGGQSAPELFERARRLWDRLAARLPETLRDVFWRDVRRASVARRTRVEQRPDSSERDDAAALRRLLSLSRRLNSSLALEQVLLYAVDAAVELTSAERGFLVLKDADNAPRIAAQRSDLGSSEPPSGGVVGRVLSTEEPVLTTDAETDPRLYGHGSVHAMRLKSILCVPVSSPAVILGALYVDSRIQRTRFQAADRELLMALADQVAVAVTNARLHAELDAQRREVMEQKRAVERLSRSKDRELVRLRERIQEQRRSLELRYDYARIVGRSAAMRHVLEQLDRIIDSEASVLIQGESGTGKELVARAIHVNGSRRDAPFVGVNCAALPESLLESELFGHVRGAFTGAERDRKGLLLQANGGSFFLDEIGEMPLAIQAKLLRVLQEREVRPLGASHVVPIDVRVISATHRDLTEEVRHSRFREDLYYRLAVVTVSLPPLRERPEDLPALATAILDRLAREAGKEPHVLTQEALKKLQTHAFPGNVRELENLLTRARVFAEGSRILAGDIQLVKASVGRASRTRGEFRAEERDRILQALRGARWNVSHVSRALGIPRNTLYRKMRIYGIGRVEENDGAGGAD